MIKQRFVLDESRRLFLDLTARTKWTDVRLSIGTTSLGPPLNRADLREGQSYTLADESVLLVQLEMPVFLPTLRIERDGIVVPGSEASAEYLTERAGRWLIGVGILTILVAFAGPMMAIRNALFLVGLFWVATGFFARRGSLPALVLGSGLYFLGALQGITSANMTTIFLQVVILTPMFRALYAHYLDRNAAARPLRRDHVPLAVVQSAIRPPTDFAETIAPSSRPPIAGGEAPPAPPAAAPPPMVQAQAAGTAERSDQKIGAYIVTGTLGSGGMATVYKARQTSIGRDVALKVITGNHQADPEFFERFRREAETTARLSHPNILKIFDFGEDAGRPFLAMEYMSGGTLRSRIGATALPVAQVLKWAEQVGAAIQSAHSQGVVHRDIKPENVLLDQAGNAFLADFGLARLSDAKSNLTQIGTQMGSPSYMSPEQWDGADVTEAADLYSFGAMLFELLSGSPPFRAATLPALMTQHVKAPVPSVRALRPSLPASMDAFFAKALAKASDQRFADGGAMVDGLRLALRGATVAQPAGSASQPVRPVAQPARPVTQTMRPITQTVRPVTQTVRPVAPPSSSARPARAAAPSKSWVDLIRSPVGIAVAVLLVLAGFGAWRQRSPLPGAERGADASARPSETRPAPARAALPALPPATLAGDMHPLPYRLSDAAFSRALNRIVVIADGTAAVMIVDPETAETSRVELPGFPRTVTTSPEGLAALVTSDSAIWLVNLASRTIDHTVNVNVKGSTAVMGSWAYILPERDQGENLRSINLLTGEIKTGLQPVSAGGLMKAHQSGRRLYMVDRHLSPEDIYRVDAALGPALAVKDSRFHGDHPICDDLWFSEKGDFAFTGCGNAFSLSDDPAADMDFAGAIPNLQAQKISAFTHSDVAGRVLLVADRTVKTPGRDDDSRDTLMTYEFPGFRFVARDVLPRLGTSENPVKAVGRFIFANRDGRRMYVILETPAASSKVSSAILAAGIQ